MAVNLHTNHFRFGIDELAESTHGWYAAEDVNPAQGVIPLDTVFLLRFNVQETGGTAAANVDNTFEFRINAGAWTALTTTSVGPRAVAAVALTNGSACTQRLSGTGTFESSGAGQTEDGTSGGAANDIAASGCSETECGIIIDSADVAGGDVIEFRITSPDFPVTNDVVPTVTVAINADAELSWAELEIPDAQAAAEISWAELEIPDPPADAELSWAEFEVPTPNSDAELSWAELEVPDAQAAGEVSWAELEVPDPPSYTSYGRPFLYTAANWSGLAFFLEVYMRATVGTAFARLWDETAGAAVAGSVLSTTAGTLTRLRSGALTLVTGNLYRVQFGKAGTDAGEFLGAHLVAA